MTSDLLRTRRFGATLIVISAITLAGCRGATGGGSPSSEPGASDASAASAAASVSASAAPTAEPSDSGGPFACALPVTGDASGTRAQITDIRVGEQDGYDRIVFEFASGTPEYRIETAAPPFIQDPSGLPMNVSGTTFWKIVMQGGTMVSPDSIATYSGPTTFTPGFDKLVQLVNGGDFEAVSTWYVGLSDISCLRAQTLSSPSRLVIDVQR